MATVLLPSHLLPSAPPRLRWSGEFRALPEPLYAGICSVQGGECGYSGSSPSLWLPQQKLVRSRGVWDIRCRMKRQCFDLPVLNITLSWKYMNIHSSAHDVFVMLYLHALRSSCLLLRQEAGARSGLPAVGVRLPAVVDKLQVSVCGGVWRCLLSVPHASTCLCKRLQIMHVTSTYRKCVKPAVFK